MNCLSNVHSNTKTMYIYVDINKSVCQQFPKSELFGTP